MGRGERPGAGGAREPTARPGSLGPSWGSAAAAGRIPVTQSPAARERPAEEGRGPEALAPTQPRPAPGFVGPPGPRGGKARAVLHPGRPAPLSADRAPRCEGPREAAGNQAGLALSWGRGFESGPSCQASGTATDRGHGKERGARGRHGGRRAHGRLFNVTSEMGSICPPGKMGGERRVLGRNQREGEARGAQWREPSSDQG